MLTGRAKFRGNRTARTLPPLNFYGQTKLADELTVRKLTEKFFIVRITWVFGLNGNNFIKTMLHPRQMHLTLCVVNVRRPIR